MMSIRVLPFRLAPSPAQFIATGVHATALAQLRYSLAAGNGLTLLDGPPGTGKTTLALKLLGELARDTTPIYMPNSRFDTPSDLFRAILTDLEVDWSTDREADLRASVQNSLMQRAQKPAILALDDAHELGVAVLDELRRLDNLSIGGTAALPVVLIADLSFKDRIPASLATRIGVHVRLTALEATCATRFVVEQLRASKIEAAFSEEALTLIAAESAGVPRALNRLASLSLALALEAGEDLIDVEAVLEASARLAPPAQPADSPESIRSPSDQDDAAGSRTPKNKLRKRKAA